MDARKAAAEGLLLSEEIPTAVVTLDSKVESLNSALADALHVPEEVAAGHSFGSLLPPSQRITASTLLRQAGMGRSSSTVRVLELPGLTRNS